MAVNDIDELNILRRVRGDTYQRYKKFFSEMDVSEERVENRVKLAILFDDQMLTLLALALILWEAGQYDRADMRERFRTAYISAVDGAGRLDDFTEERADTFAEEVERTTYEGLGKDIPKPGEEDITLGGTPVGGTGTGGVPGAGKEPYATSTDRAVTIAVTESAIAEGHHEFEEAVKAGKTRKTWVTKRDKRVRKTHKEVDGKTLPITEPFILSGTEMQFPGDTTNDPPADEVVNCRCSLHFS